MRETVFRSEDLPVADRCEWWCELTSRTLVPTAVVSRVHADEFRAGLRLLDFGAVQVSVMSYSLLRSRRTPALVRRSDPELYQLALTLRGEQGLSHCGRDARVGVGDLLLYGTSHPFDALTFPEGGTTEVIIVTVPRAAVAVPAGKVDRLLAVPMPGSTGMGALLSQFLTRLAAESASYRPQDTARLGAVTVDLITAQLAHHLDAEDAVAPESRRRTLMVSIRSFIEDNLGDAQLSPAAIAAAHHISVRYLHQLFQQQGTTVGSWIRHRRLERCRRDLAEPQLSTRPIHAVGSRWGFRHAADFNRAFRDAYGMPPGDYRQRANASR